LFKIQLFIISITTVPKY